MEKQKPKKLSFLVFRHDLETVAARADLAHRILLSAEEHNPNFVITPKGSFPTAGGLDDFYRALKKTSRRTILVTGGYDFREISKALVRPEEKESELVEGIKSQAIVIPAKPSNHSYDLLILLGKDKEEFGFLKYVENLKIGGYLIKNSNTSSDCVARVHKIVDDKRVFEIKQPLVRDKQGIFEFYVLQFN